MGVMGDRSAVTESLIIARERQRVSHELHRSTSQLLVALQLQVGQLRHCDGDRLPPLLDEMDQVLREIHESIRQIGTPDGKDDDEVQVAAAAVAKVFFSLGAFDQA